MRRDHIFFDAVELKVAFGVQKCRFRMVKGVLLSLFVGNVPVVEKIIVQERAADEGFLVHFEAQLPCNHYAERGDQYRMRIYAHFSVLNELFFLLHSARTQYISAVALYFIVYTVLFQNITVLRDKIYLISIAQKSGKNIFLNEF